MTSFHLPRTTLYGNKYKIIEHILDFIKTNHRNILPSLDLLKNLDKPNNMSFWSIDPVNKKYYVIHILFDNFFNLSDGEVKNRLLYVGSYVYKEIKISLRKSSDFESHFMMLRRKYSISNIRINTKYINEHLINTADFSIQPKNINFISATKIRNYLLNDPLLDYLFEFNIQNIYDIPKKSNSNKKIILHTNFNKFILNEGIVHENTLIDKLKETYKITTICNSVSDICDIKFYNKTLEAMNSKDPIIYQGVLYNNTDNTFGSPDLLINNKIINEIFQCEVISNQEDSYYVVVDIKSSNLYYSSNNYILNKGSIPAYKGQLYIYLNALNSIRSYQSSIAFILGKNGIGRVDFNSSLDKEYPNLVKKAVEWIKILRTEGENWKLTPFPSRKELFPNMKNYKDDPYRQIKMILSDKIKEITSVYFLGYKSRIKLHETFVYSWDQISDEHYWLPQWNIVKEIISINKSSDEIIRPSRVTFMRNKWIKPPYNSMIFYLDFENLLPHTDKVPIIFMIGVGYYIKNKWVYKNFTINNTDLTEEHKIFKLFFSYIFKIIKNHNKRKAIFYHWSSAEPNLYKNMINRLDSSIKPNLDFTFFDLSTVFIKEPIVIKGALNFSLKTVANALKKLKLIDTIWESGNCSNGLDAAMKAHYIYKNKLDISINDEMNNIIKYNEIDCKTLMEIHRFMKKKL